MKVADNPQATYRPDIDGLRAVAVLAVLIHHLGPDWLPGGYTGVDVFFVISGFLITTLVHGDVAAKKFSFRGFYKRRINRILPALVVVIGTTALFSVVILSPRDLVLYAKSAVASLVGASNIFFWREYGNYFDANTSEATLLHTWTIGVEEQFYLLWPAFVLILVRLKGGWVLATAALAAVLALVASEWGAQHFASASYYLLPTRFFELAIGGTLAFWLRGRTNPAPRTATVSGILGFVLLGAGLLFLAPGSSFPGVNALLPCLGAALVIYAGTNRRSASARLLATAPLVAIGLASYSIYLWHWPVIAYLRYVGITIDAVVAVGVVIFVAIASFATWRFVEGPLRRSGSQQTFRRVAVLRLVVPATAFAVFALMMMRTGGMPGRFDSEVSSLEGMVATHPDELRAGCHVPAALYSTPPDTSCRLGQPTAPLDGILLGDSIANAYSGMVDVMAQSEGLAFMDYTMDGCPPIPGYVTQGLSSHADDCLARNERAFGYVENVGFRRVILAASWPTDDDAGRLITGAIDRLLAVGIHVDVVLKNPQIPGGATCPIRRLMYGTAWSCTAPEQPEATVWASIQRQHPQVTFIRPADVICRSGTCDPVLDNIDLYRDDIHLNDVGSRLVGATFEATGTYLDRTASATKPSR